MLAHSPRSQADADPAVLISWLKSVILRPEDNLSPDVQVRLRGNILHVLCESAEAALPRHYVMMRLVRSLMEPAVKARFDNEFPQIYQIYVYSREFGSPKPRWSAPIYLNRLDKHLERLVAEDSEALAIAQDNSLSAMATSAEGIALPPETSPTADIPANSFFGAVDTVDAVDASSPSNQSLTVESSESPDVNTASQPTSRIGELRIGDLQANDFQLANPLSFERAISPEQLSDISLARQGDSAAIARYLSEALSALNVGVKVSARVVPGKARRAKTVMTVQPPQAAQANRLSSAEQAADAATDAALEVLLDATDPAVRPLNNNALEIATAEAIDAASEVASDDAYDAALIEKVEPAASHAIPDNELVSRLWVFCEASYSPDPLLIAEPIAERLRRLQLRQFQDAVITIQVTGESASDWRLRVDLTPPEEMLREWASWGDVPALSKLANQISRRYGLKLVTEFKKSTLHLISYSLKDVGQSAEDDGAERTYAIAEPFPAESRASDVAIDIVQDLTQGLTQDLTQDLAGGVTKTGIEGLVSEITALLCAIAPQGVHRAMLYGPSTDDISPEWLRGIDLPAASSSALRDSPLELARQGDMPALAYCLTRSLNPDITEQLATGGIRVQLLQKDNLLHVMADGPICPPKHAIVSLINQTLEQIKAAELVEGIRLYGRRAGQKQPIWTHGQDYQHRQRMVPEAKPEFAASEAYLGELITPVSDDSLSIITPLEEAEADVKLGALLVRGFQYAMVKSQMFVPADDTSGLRSHLPKVFQTEGGKMAFIWGAVGLFLAVQFDFMIGQALRQIAGPATAQVQAQAQAQTQARNTDRSPAVERVKPNGFDDELKNLDWQTAQGWNQPNGGNDTANGSGGFGSESDSFATDRAAERSDNDDFTTSAITDNELVYSPQQEFVSTSSLLAGSMLPTFRSQQLDEKLALYQRRVANDGPPDVLVIGSSRALRGVDPAALRQALGTAGYKDLSIFNFGVNGATAQVVDLIVRRLIPADQLPQIIVWADGARAFNSGRVDVTFETIAQSEGYQQLEAIATPGGMNDLALGSLSARLTARANMADQRLSEFFGNVSSGYTSRSKIRTAIGQGFGAIAPNFLSDESTQAGDTPTGAPTETSLIDFDGFLALSTRFNPATYYQDHARVPGSYDGDYKAFQLEGVQMEALDNLLAYSTDQEIPVLFINTPLTDEYLDNHRSQAEEDFLQYMVQKADTYSIFSFRDLGQLWPQRYDYFSDPSHLNRYGAYQVSNRLAQDPLIEWPQARPKPEKTSQSSSAEQ
jgi:hypothetical protein